MSGQVSSLETYITTGFWSAVAGAVSGGIGSGVTGVLTAKVKVLGPMVINGLGGVVETLAENAVLGVKTELSDLGLAFGLSVVLPGIGDNLVRGLKGMAGQLDNVLRGASRQADEALEAALKQTDEALEAAGKQADDAMDTLPPKEPDTDTPDVQVEGGPDISDTVKRIEEIKVEFNYSSKYDETEFARQLADQQKGMNELTVQEYLDNRQKYIEQGRAVEGNAAQQAARKQYL